MGVTIRWERIKTTTSLPAYHMIVRGNREFLENIGSCRLFGAYKIIHIKKERLTHWLRSGAICSKRVIKELMNHGVER